MKSKLTILAFLFLIAFEPLILKAEDTDTFIRDIQQKRYMKKQLENEKIQLQNQQQQLDLEKEQNRQQENAQEQKGADELNTFVHKKYEEYEAKMEDINIERETLGMKPKEILKYNDWAQPKGSENESITTARELKSVIETRASYSDYVISYEKINLKRKKAKLKPKKIQTYVEWKAANAVITPSLDTVAPPSIEENSAKPDGNVPPLPHLDK